MVGKERKKNDEPLPRMAVEVVRDTSLPATDAACAPTADSVSDWRIQHLNVLLNGKWEHLVERVAVLGQRRPHVALEVELGRDALVEVLKQRALVLRSP